MIKHNKSLVIKLAESLSKKRKKTKLEISALEILMKFFTTEQDVAFPENVQKSKKDDVDDKEDQ